MPSTTLPADAICDQTDPLSGRHVRRWTSSPAKDQHLYFTSPTVTADGRWLAIISERSGDPNLFVIDRADGSLRQVSDNRAGLLHGYVYPRGGASGLAKASPALHAASGRLVWIQDDALWTAWAGRGDPPQRVCALPAGWWSGFTDISACGRFACVCVTEPAAFADAAEKQWDQLRKVVGRFREHGLSSRVILIDCVVGAVVWDHAVPFWVSHINLHPRDPQRVIINQEGYVAQRIWRLEGGSGKVTPLFPQLAREFVCHENWDPQGEAVVYHGSHEGTTFVERRTWDGRRLTRLETGAVGFVHATMSCDGASFIIDRTDGVIAQWHLADGSITPLCRHDSDFDDQDAHPHARMAPNGRSVLFTSCREGSCNVYEVDLTS